MKTFKIDTLKWQKENILFPEHIFNDVSVLYHGTSSINEQAIDLNGFISSKQIFSKEDIFSLIKSYIRMGWFGKATGGFVVLHSFSKWDHSRLEGNPIFFHYDPVKCLTYADKDFSGGEKARSIRYCGDDLRSILSDDEIYANYKDSFDKIKPQMNFYAQEIGFPINEVRLHSRDEIVEIYDSHETLWEVTSNVFSEHQYGVVYAIKFDDRTVKVLRDGGPMGILSFTDVPPIQILGKVIVNDEIQKFRAKGDNIEKLMKWFDSDFYKNISKMDKS